MDRLWHPHVRHTHSALSTTITRANHAVLWHRRLGNAHPEAVIKHLHHNYNISISRSEFPPCDSCAMGRLPQSPSTSSFHQSSQLLDTIHSDLMGPISPPTKSGARYVMTFINDHTRYNTCYLLKSKDEAFEKVKQFQSMIEKQTGKQIVKLKTDQEENTTHLNY